MLELLQPLHPKVVHFPVALFITALFLEGIHLVNKKDIWHQSAVILYVMAAIITPFVVRTGIWEAEKTGIHHPVLDFHRQFALWTMWLSLMSLPVLWIFFRERPRWMKPVFVCLLIAVAICVTLAGHYGGTMVYEYGVGTDLF